jgi:hypothetical protein
MYWLLAACNSIDRKNPTDTPTAIATSISPTSRAHDEKLFSGRMSVPRNSTLPCSSELFVIPVLNSRKPNSKSAERPRNPVITKKFGWKRTNDKDASRRLSTLSALPNSIFDSGRALSRASLRSAMFPFRRFASDLGARRAVTTAETLVVPRIEAMTGNRSITKLSTLPRHRSNSVSPFPMAVRGFVEFVSRSVGWATSATDLWVL